MNIFAHMCKRKEKGMSVAYMHMSMCRKQNFEFAKSARAFLT